jgi:peptidoglycan/LPS O-acetylase OafA/YrhL
MSYEPVQENLRHKGRRLNKSSSNLFGRFVFLDGLRAIAAVAVMLFHFFNQWVSPLHDSLAAILPSGIQFLLRHADVGVDVFFVVSGFVIAHSLFGVKITPKYAGRFIFRRSLRLDPPYWVAIAFSLALPCIVIPKFAPTLMSRVGGTSGVLVNMFYLPDLLWKPRIVGVAWTLCLEVQFYLAFLCALAISDALKSWVPANIRRLRNILTTIGFASLLGYSVYRWFDSGENDFAGRWFMFFTGVLAYWTLQGLVKPGLFYCYIATIFVLSVARHEPQSATTIIASSVIYIAALTGGLKAWLSGPVFQYLGRISYSLYLMHMTIGIAVIHLVMHFGNGSTAAVVAAFAAAIGVSILSADLLYRFVESPAMRLSKYFRQDRTPSPSAITRTIRGPSALAPLDALLSNRMMEFIPMPSDRPLFYNDSKSDAPIPDFPGIAIVQN